MFCIIGSEALAHHPTTFQLDSIRTLKWAVAILTDIVHEDTSVCDLWLEG